MSPDSRNGNECSSFFKLQVPLLSENWTLLVGRTKVQYLHILNNYSFLKTSFIVFVQEMKFALFTTLPPSIINHYRYSNTITHNANYDDSAHSQPSDERLRKYRGTGMVTGLSYVDQKFRIKDEGKGRILQVWKISLRVL